MGGPAWTKSCSSVPRSFSRTIEKAVRNVVTFSRRIAVKPGKRNSGNGVRVEEQLGADIDRKSGTILKNAAERFVEADGGGHVDGLAGDRGVRAVDEARTWALMLWRRRSE